MQRDLRGRTRGGRCPVFDQIQPFRHRTSLAVTCCFLLSHTRQDRGLRFHLSFRFSTFFLFALLCNIMSFIIMSTHTRHRSLSVFKDIQTTASRPLLSLPSLTQKVLHTSFSFPCSKLTHCWAPFSRSLLSSFQTNKQPDNHS